MDLKCLLIETNTNLSFKDLLLRVYALDLYKLFMVFDRIRLVNWFLVFKRPPRGGEEMLQYESLRSCLAHVTMRVLGSGRLTLMWISAVASARALIDSIILEVVLQPSRWNRLIPSKGKMIFLRLNLNNVSTRLNLG